MSIQANRFKGIRATVVFDAFTAEMSRAHNNSNILCLGERSLTEPVSLDLVRIWLTTPFEGGRHEKRVQKLDN